MKQKLKYQFSLTFLALHKNLPGRFKMKNDGEMTGIKLPLHSPQGTTGRTIVSKPGRSEI